MPTLQHKVSINRSVTDVFKFVSDFSNNSKWQPSSVSMERSGQLRLGEMIVGKRRLMGRMAFVNADVVDYSPNQTIAYTGVMGGYPFRSTLKFNHATGGVELTEIIDVRIPWMYFWARPFVLSALNGQIQKSLESLKTYMEAHRDRA
ncbi:MAG: SRPBCC family protein [Anaerolineae bacterium]|nr:SRPBCC family protein [Anaerolineae bacterium]